MVKPNGAKLWRWKYRIGGRENTFAIGSYPAVTLAQARFRRDEARELAKQGIHPSHNRQAQLTAQVAENATTFKAVACEWVDQRRGKWSGFYLRQV